MEGKVRYKTLAAAVLIASGLSSGAAHASTITVTWDPAASPNGPGLSSTVNSITQNNQVISDFSMTVINPTTGAFTDTGYLPITEFQLNGAHVAGGGISSNYSLYYQYTATGNFYTSSGAAGFNPNGIDTATFSGLTYSLVGANGSAAFSFPNPTSNPTVSGIGSPITLATGVLDPAGGSTGSVASGLPSAQVYATFSPVNSESGFFIAPPVSGYVGLSLDSAFTNTSSVVKFTASGGDYYLEVNGGGGDANFAVPEPNSLIVLGSGLLCLGMILRRANKIGQH